VQEKEQGKWGRRGWLVFDLEGGSICVLMKEKEERSEWGARRHGDHVMR
jgi:hypothetical protein